jgi:nicotinate-nucleotide adenylyltransferase
MIKYQKGQNINIALYGGSFDPIHIGHKTIIKKSLSTLSIDKLIIMPTYLNPFKKRFHINPQDRLQNMKKFCQNLHKCEVSSWEVDQKRPVPTVETVRYLYTVYNINKLYLIIGADNLCHIQTWENYKELENMVVFVVATRDGIDTQKYQTLDVCCNISSSDIRADS